MTRRLRGRAAFTPLAACAVAGLSLVAACRFGGPSGNPEDPITFPDEGGADASDDATLEPSSDGGLPASGPDGAPADDGPTGDASEDGPSVAGEGGAGVPEGGCTPTVPVCDPVHDTGCNPFQQCDVDPSATANAAGLCLFGSAANDAGPCTSSVVSESCPAKHTCVSGDCRALCFCDRDCPAGQCCSDSTGPKGFLLCQACP